LYGGFVNRAVNERNQLECAMRYVAVAAQPPCRIPDRHG
jgi:hypothetical protein